MNIKHVPLRFHRNPNRNRNPAPGSCSPKIGTKRGMYSLVEELGHPQQKTQIHCNNASAVGIANNTVKRQRSQSMEMRYLGVCDKIAQDAYSVKWHPGQENLANYQSKHHLGPHHNSVRPWYQHEKNFPLVLPWATWSSTLKGCVGTLPEGYIRNVPLPRVPIIQSTSSETRHQVHTLPDNYVSTYVVPMYNSPRSIVERAAFAFSPAWHDIAINN